MCCVFISLSIITTLNSTHARQQSLLLLTGRHRRVLSSSHVVYSTHSNHTLCTQHTTHTRHLIQFKPPLLPATAPPSRLCSLPALTSLFSLDRRGGRLRLSQPSRIPSRTNNSTHTPARKREEDTLKTALDVLQNTQLQQRPPPQLISRRTQRPRLSSTGTYLIDLPLCDLTPSR